MNDLPKTMTLHEQRDAYFDKACKAEAKGEFAEAQRLLTLALDCEGASQQPADNASECVQQANPVCQPDQAATPAANPPTTGSGTVEAVSQG